ncbi:MAG: hypothetical protein CSA11_05670 [Chloroflexi bacterium]|nr:MAG: hypothetical protein CSB13_08540 [Chloroflexota bacterium]PIE80947.1 MAG: hypothetical protein CSA11_05670 [Chloroflexota bacterium]
MSMQTSNQTTTQSSPKSVNSNLPQNISDTAPNHGGMPTSSPAYHQPNQERLISTKVVIIGIIAVIIVIASIALIIFLAANYAPEMEALRDIMIIALALESCIFGIALLILLVMVIRLVNMLEFEIKPILERTNETISMVRGTTLFMGDNVVKPITTASSYAAGIRKGLKTLFGDPRQNIK